MSSTYHSITHFLYLPLLKVMYADLKRTGEQERIVEEEVKKENN
jgi:hypothetical protein